MKDEDIQLLWKQLEEEWEHQAEEESRYETWLQEYEKEIKKEERFKKGKVNESKEIDY